jgi:hypothetical protein
VCSKLPRPSLIKKLRVLGSKGVAGGQRAPRLAVVRAARRRPAAPVSAPLRPGAELRERRSAGLIEYLAQLSTRGQTMIVKGGGELTIPGYISE